MLRTKLAMWSAQVTALIVASTACSVTAQGAVLPDASTFQLTPDHSGVTSAGAPLEMPSAPMWSQTLPDAVSYPIIAGGRVFVTVSGTSVGGTGNQLFAFDAFTGKSLWTPVDLPGSYGVATPAYDAGKVFVASYDGTVWAIDAATGSKVWTSTVTSTVESPPIATNGVLYTTGNYANALDERTGTVLWTAHEVGDPGSPAFGSGSLFVNPACYAMALAAATGVNLWSYNSGCGGGGGATAVYRGGRVYVRDLLGQEPQIIFDAATGSALGTFSSVVIPAVSDTQGFFLSGGVLSAINLATNVSTWSFLGDGDLVTAPIVIDNEVVVGSIAGNLYAVDTASGERKWKLYLGAEINPTEEFGPLRPVSGLGFADGVLVVPAGNTLFGIGLAQTLTGTIDASASSVGIGQTATISWSAPAATQCTTRGTGWADGTVVAANGHQVSSPLSSPGSATFGLTCSNASGFVDLETSVAVGQSGGGGGGLSPDVAVIAMLAALVRLQGRSRRKDTG